MSDFFQALILGIVQGLTEFLPISSTGHLVVVPKIFGWEGVVSTLSFDVALHIGSTIAVLSFFWKDWARLLIAFSQNLSQGFGKIWSDHDSRLLLLLILGSVPAGLVGLALEDLIETSLRSLSLVAAAMIGFGLVLFWADRLAGKRGVEKANLADAIFVGIAQALALIPGVSRSGITITAGLMRGMSRESATKFSFLLSTPAIVGAALLKSKDVVSQGLDGQQGIFLVGMIAAAVSGWVAIKFLITFVQTNTFRVFVVYRIVVGIAILVIASRL